MAEEKPANAPRRPVALVTGGSRGIGAASALALAAAGYDIALAARTLSEGTGVLEGDHHGRVPDRPIAGSLEAVAEGVRQRGGRVLTLRMDVLDRDSVVATAKGVLESWGRIDVLVAVAAYKGPGSADPFLGTPIELIERAIEGDITNQIVLLQHVIPAMLEQGGGTIVNMSSNVATLNPPGPAGEGGWGFAYAVGKGGFDRIAGVLNAELGGRGIVAYNTEPGLTTYGIRLAEQREQFPWASVDNPGTIGNAVAWLVTHPEEAKPLLPRRIHLPKVARDHGLVAPDEDYFHE
jgi:NAD(P)-dependent dehydrogenase (short-subunit alcohol dehydrogenase family)